MSDRRHEPPGAASPDHRAVVGSGPVVPTGATAATGTEADGGWGTGAGGEASVAAAGCRPPPRDLREAVGSGVGLGGGGGRVAAAAAAAAPRAATAPAPAPNNPPQDPPSTGGGMMLSLCDAAAAAASDDEERGRMVVSGPDAAGGDAAAAASGEVLDLPDLPQDRATADPDDERNHAPGGAGPMEGDEEGDDEEEQGWDEDVQYVKTTASNRTSKGGKRGPEKKKRKKSGAATGGSSASTSGSTRSTRRSDLKSRLEQVGVGSRVGIYWELDKTYYPATIIARHEDWPHTYTYLYDDGEQESFDLNTHQQFQVLDDAVPKAARDVIAAVRSGGGGEGGSARIAVGRTRSTAGAGGGGDATNERDEHGKDWVCSTCQTTNPYEKKLCQCPSTRRKDNSGDRKAAKKPNRSKSFDRASSKRSSSQPAAASSKSDLTVDEISILLEARQRPENLSFPASISVDRDAHDDDSSEDEAPQGDNMATGGEAEVEESTGWECPSCETINPHQKKLCACKSARNRLCAIPACPKAKQGHQYNHMCANHYHNSTITGGWTCPLCQTLNYPSAPKCRKLGCRSSDQSPNKEAAASSLKKNSTGKKTAKKKPGKSDTFDRPATRKSSQPRSSSIPAELQAPDSSGSPAKKKNPYAGLKQRDAPRTSTKNQCGHCDACMVDDCGECENCLDMKRFGGPYKKRQKCSHRPPCHNPPSKSPTKTSKSRAPSSPSQRASGTSRPGRPPRAKTAPPLPPVGSIELDPLSQAKEVLVPKSTDSCAWSFDGKTRVLLAKFNLKNNSNIDPGHKESLLKLMERDDVTVVSEGLVGDLNQTLWHLDYVESLVGDKPYHKVRRFERELVELSLPAEKPKSGNVEVDEEIASGGANTSTAAAAAAPATAPAASASMSASASTTAGESSTGQSQRFHVRHKEVDKNLSMKVSDYCKYLNKRAVALEKIVEKRMEEGIDPVNPASLEDDRIGRSTDLEGQNPEFFTFLTHDGEEETINVVNEVLYLIDYDMVKLLPPLYEDFVNNFKLPDCLPGGRQCMMNAVNVNGRPFMGPNFYVTPPASFTHFHQDGHGTVDSGHTCLSGYNEVVMLRRMSEEHKQRALYILNDQKNKKKQSKYDGLYGLPHGDGLGDKPDWPTVDAIEECRRMNYYPSVFVLKPGQFVHINKGRLHAFRKLSPTALPPNDCHEQLRLDTIANERLSSKEHICISVAWDWMYKGRTENGICEEVNSTLHCARLLRGHQLQSLAIPELSVLHTAIQLVAEYERIEAPADKGRGMLPFLEDGHSANSEAVRENLNGIAPAMEYIIDRHERAFQAAEQQRDLQSSQIECRATLEIFAVPDASENPESYALDPYGNGDYYCRLCHEELSNIYMHCDGCEGILNKDYNICVSCHGDGRYKEFAQMHPSRATKNSAVNHTGNNERDIRGNKCLCKYGKACTRCGFCSGCSCKCHQCFTMHMRFSSMDEMLALRDRVRKVVGTRPIPTVLLGSASGSNSPSASAFYLPPSEIGGAAASGMATAEEDSVPDVASGIVASSREKRAKRRRRDSQSSSSSINEEKKEDSGVGGGTFDAFAGGRQQKRKKSESSEDSLSELASGGNLKVDEDAIKVDDDEDQRKSSASRKRSRDDDDKGTSNDQAIADAMQESEYGNDMARSTTQSSAVRLVRRDDNDGQKIIDLEDGSSALLYRKIGSQSDVEADESPSPRKERKTARSKQENKGHVGDGDWDCHLCGNSNDCNKARCSKCKGWKGGKKPSFAGSTIAPSKEKKQGKKRSPTSKNTSPAIASSSSKRKKSSSSRKQSPGDSTRCVIFTCSKLSGGPKTKNMCEEHYANSQAVDRKRPRDGRPLCSIKGCPKLADGARHNGMCLTHYKKPEQGLNSDESGEEKEEEEDVEEVDETLEDRPTDVSDESEDDDDTKLPAQQEDAEPANGDNEETSVAAPIEEDGLPEDHLVPKHQPQLPSSDEEQQAAKPTSSASSRVSGTNIAEVQQIAEQQGESQPIDGNDEEIEVIGKTAAAAASSGTDNDPGHRSSSRASTRARSRGTSVANTPTFEPKDKVDLIKKGGQALIAPYADSGTSKRSLPTKNGLTPAIVLQLLEDHENADPSVGMLIAALPKECGLTRDHPEHRKMIRHLYRNFQGEEDLLLNKIGDNLPVSSQERDLCVYAAALEKPFFSFLQHFIPYRSQGDVVKIYRHVELKGLHHHEEHVAHVERTIGLIERLEGPIEAREGGANDDDDERKK